MTPEQKHADAVEAAREWQAEQRERMVMPNRDELVTIRWPGAEYDFVMRFLYEDDKMCGAAPGWHWLHGSIVEPAEWHNRPWSLMARLVDGEWTMLPKGGKVSDVS